MRAQSPRDLDIACRFASHLIYLILTVNPFVLLISCALLSYCFHSPRFVEFIGSFKIQVSRTQTLLGPWIFDSLSSGHHHQRVICGRLQVWSLFRLVGRTDTRSVSARPMITKHAASKTRKQPTGDSEASSSQRPHRSRQGHNPKLQHDVTSSSGHNTSDETAAAVSACPTTDRDTTEIEIVQRTLESLGAPRVSKQDFKALYASPLGASLKVIAERVRGVEGARKSREVIAR